MIPWEKQVDIALGPALASAMNGLAEDGFPFLVVALHLHGENDAQREVIFVRGEPDPAAQVNVRLRISLAGHA